MPNSRRPTKRLPFVPNAPVSISLPSGNQNRRTILLDPSGIWISENRINSARIECVHDLRLPKYSSTCKTIVRFSVRLLTEDRQHRQQFYRRTPFFFIFWSLQYSPFLPRQFLAGNGAQNYDLFSSSHSVIAGVSGFIHTWYGAVDVCRNIRLFAIFA